MSSPLILLGIHFSSWVPREQEQLYTRFWGECYVQLMNQSAIQQDACRGHNRLEKCGLWSQEDCGARSKFISLSVLICEVGHHPLLQRVVLRTKQEDHKSALSVVPGTLKSSTNLIIIIGAPTCSVCSVSAQRRFSVRCEAGP